MKTRTFLLVIITLISQQAFSQIYPSFGPEIKVSIAGLTFDAMEPFISPDGNTLFFNSLNMGGNTNLYYATKVNDSTFTYVGMVAGCYNPSPNHLDAVASLDSLNNFYWTSLRSIPNLYRGHYLGGNVSGISKVYGSCNILTPGWLIMDAAIHYQGNLLYYSNAYFGPTYTECVGVPCKAKLGVAQKVNDSTFNKTPFSDTLFRNINDTNYIVYAPQITRDGLELYYTRLLKGGNNTEICVSVRNTAADIFSLPTVIYADSGYSPEAASPTTDKQKIYYHKKDNALVFRIYLRYRTQTTGTDENTTKSALTVYPNPAHNLININLPLPTNDFEIEVYTVVGEKILTTNTKKSFDISGLPNGTYFVKTKQGTKTWMNKIIKN